MIISNHKAVQRAKIWLIRVPLMLTLTVLVLYLFDWFPVKEVLWVLAGLTVLCILATLVLRMHFIEVSVEAGKLYVRFYHVFPLIREYRMVEVPPGQLLRAEIRPVTWGLTEVLLLTVQTTRGVAVFPELPLTLMSRKQRELIFQVIQTCLAD